jgi:hypothetical protein
MRRPWIKIETATPDKPEICAIASRLRMDEDMVVGKLVRLWSWVALNRINGNDLGVTLEFIDKLVSRKGFSAALQKAGWLIEQGGKLSIPNFDRHNSDLAKTRALTSQRVARHRVNKSLESNDNDKVVTKSLNPDENEPAWNTATHGNDFSNLPPLTEDGESDANTSEETSVTKHASNEPLSTEGEGDLDTVLSINAIPTFKPLHLESALDQAMAEEPSPEVLTSSPIEIEPQTPSPAKKSRRKLESKNEGQALLF